MPEGVAFLIHSATFSHPICITGLYSIGLYFLKINNRNILKHYCLFNGAENWIRS